MIPVSDRQKCFGCSACAAVCPAGAIRMFPDCSGFLYPQIDAKKCVECGDCRVVCPVEAPGEHSVNVFRGLKAKGSVRMESTSGGAFRLLADSVVLEEGVVFGCNFDDRWHLSYRDAKNVEDVKLLLGTKYVQADPGDSFRKVPEYLEEGRKVLYFGNPCMVHGMKLFVKERLGRIPENFILVDHICYGVPSPKFWEQYALYLEKTVGGRMVSFDFRAKKEPDSGHTICFKMEKDGEIKEHTVKFSADPYVRIFNKNLSLRNSCFSCRYCTEDRESDVTLGDFWGIENVDPDFDDGYGVSLVITHSEKGEELVKEILQDTDYFMTDAASASQPRLHECGKAPFLRKLFLNDMEKASGSDLNMAMFLKKYGA